jgi:hypothetical protein
LNMLTLLVDHFLFRWEVNRLSQRRETPMQVFERTISDF